LKFICPYLWCQIHISFEVSAAKHSWSNTCISILKVLLL
jgi:hypothetical protein